MIFYWMIAEGQKVNSIVYPLVYHFTRSQLKVNHLFIIFEDDNTSNSDASPIIQHWLKDSIIERAVLKINCENCAH